MEYNVGDKIDPCGSPALIVSAADSVLLTETTNVLSERKFAMIAHRYFGILDWRSLNIKPLCQTVSNAFSTSKMTNPVDHFRRLLFCIMLVMRLIWCTAL